ncbi:MAG: 5'-nucleotidase [Candidatus Pacebacteria bacterium GW2011_GWF1_36_5]|nr:MAG: 5'-nucleotidase [Candidatus Pacebacteria bacterium GW2011_GWF1_36_5]
MVFDEKNFLLEMVQPIIHTSNKTGALLIKDNLLDASPERRHCLLIGDGLDDVKMAKGIDFDFTYKVAFGSNNLEHFKKVFDLVLPIDGSYKEIIDLFD